MFIFIQAVYNANKYAKLVRKRERLQNWLDYNQLKFERHPEKRPTKKVVCSYELKYSKCDLLNVYLHIFTIHQLIIEALNLMV